MMHGATFSRPESLQQRVVVAVAQALSAEAAGHGIPFLPRNFAGAVIERAVNDLNSLPVERLQSLSLTDSGLVGAVSTSFNTVMSQLSQDQQRALKEGRDPYAQTMTQGPEAMGAPARLGASRDGGEASRSGARFATLRSADEAREAQAREFADLGLGRSTVSAFNAIGLDRDTFDFYRRRGFSAAHIAATAHDAQALGFKGREDVDIAMHAPNDLRGAAAAIAKAKTPEQKAGAEKHYEELKQKYERLPDSDPRKHDAQRFIQRVNERNLHGAKHDAPGARASSDRHVAQTERPATEFKGKKDVAAKGEKAHDVLMAGLAFSPGAPTVSAASEKPVTVAKADAPVTDKKEVAANEPPKKPKPVQTAALKPPGMST